MKNLAKVRSRLLTTEDKRAKLIHVLLAIWPLPFLWPYVIRKPFRSGFHGHRQVAGYFQSLALMHDPIESWTYLTPAESASGVHMHSILSVPFMFIWEIKAGAVLALLAGATAAYLLARLTAIYSGVMMGGVTATVFWAHPLTLKFATHWMPETLSITLVTAVLYTAVCHYRRKCIPKYLIIILLSIAMTVHLWEVAILLPLVSIALWYRDLRGAGLYILGAVVTAIVILAISHLQSFTQESMLRFAIWNNPSVVLTSDFWHLPPQHWLGYSLTVTLPIVIILTIMVGAVFYKYRQEEHLLVGTWLLAGISIPIGLANGFHFHTYYLWLTLPALSVAVGILGTTIISKISTNQRRWLIRGGVAGIIIFGSIAGLSVARISMDGIGSHAWADTDKEIGREIASRDVKPSEIVFVGNFNSGHFGQNPTMGRILVYSDLLITERRPTYKSDPPYPSGAPRYYENVSKPVSECEILIIRNDSNLRINDCN